MILWYQYTGLLSDTHIAIPAAEVTKVPSADLPIRDIYEGTEAEVSAL